MLKIFCSKCGDKHEYTDRIPHFCKECGNPFNSSIASAPKPKVIVRKEDSEEYENDAAEIPNIDKLDVEIDIRRQKTTIGDLVGTKQDKNENFTRPIPKKMTKKELLEEFRREAGNIRDRKIESKQID